MMVCPDTNDTARCYVKLEVGRERGAGREGKKEGKVMSRGKEGRCADYLN
jgi:hypothetical protein